jgi:hypothetical protein
LHLPTGWLKTTFLCLTPMIHQFPIDFAHNPQLYPSLRTHLRPPQLVWQRQCYPCDPKVGVWLSPMIVAMWTSDTHAWVGKYCRGVKLPWTTSRRTGRVQPHSYKELPIPEGFVRIRATVQEKRKRVKPVACYDIIHQHTIPFPQQPGLQMVL